MKKRGMWIALLTALAVMAEPELGWNEKGLGIKAGSLGEFTLEDPQLVKDGKATAPLPRSFAGEEMVFTYPGDGVIRARLERNTLTLNFTGVPADAQLTMRMILPLSLRDGGSWRVGEQKGTFPAGLTRGKPHFFQGHGADFEFGDDAGRTLSIVNPAPGLFQQLTDNREWNWPVYGWQFWSVVGDGRAQTLTITGREGAAGRAARVDRFGQPVAKEFPGKISDEKEFALDRESEAAYFRGFAGPVTDRFGGLPDSGTKLGLDKTGYFHLERKNGRDYLVDPDGNLFFHLGICCFGDPADYTYAGGREDIYQWLPPRSGGFEKAWHPDAYWNPVAVSFYWANQQRKYGKIDSGEWLKRMVDRVRSFGFNSSGAFSENLAELDRLNFPYVGMLPLQSWQIPMIKGLNGIFDPFDPEIRRKVETNFAAVLPARAGSPYLIGYFLANEQDWENLARIAPSLDGGNACKRELVAMLERKYPTIADFNRAWNCDAADFASLANRQLPLKTPAALADAAAFFEHFLNAYFELIVTNFKKYDRNHLLLGNRWQPGTANNEALCRISGKYMDVISINYYTAGIDRDFVRRIYAWSGNKPQLWSEFFYTAEKESAVGGFSYDLPTQRERGLAYRNYVETAASLGFVVGVEHFTLIDEPVTGRHFEKYNGESYNCGLFTVTDRPYRPMIDEMAKSNFIIYEVWQGVTPPWQFDHPQFAGRSGGRRTVEAGRAVAPVSVNGQDQGYPGRPPVRIPAVRVVNGASDSAVEASFKSCWDERNLYLLIRVSDPTPMRNKLNGKDLWRGDGVEIFFGAEAPDTTGPLLASDRQLLLGGGEAKLVFSANGHDGAGITAAAFPAVDGKGYTVEAAIPWRTLGVERPVEGMKFRFDLAIDDSTDGENRRAQLMWSGNARNSSDRGGWGELKLAQ